MLKTTAALTLATALVLPAMSFASSELVLTDDVKSQIQTVLEGQGYDVGKIKVEDGMYEAYAKKDGEKLEIFLNSALEIVEIETD